MIAKKHLALATSVMLLLSIIPLGPVWGLFRPLWICLFVIYCQSTFPKHCSVLFIMLLGLVVDVLGAGVLGEHAFALLFMALIVAKRAQRFRLFPMSQQLLGIIVFSSVYQVILLFIQLILGYPVSIWAGVLPVVMTVLCWPWLQYVGDRVFFAPVR